MQCSRLLYPFAWLPRRAKHHGHKVTRLSDFENSQAQWRSQGGPQGPCPPQTFGKCFFVALTKVVEVDNIKNRSHTEQPVAG